MTNTDRKVGFHPKNIKNAPTNEYRVTSSITLKDGDVARMGTNGKCRATTAGSSFPIVGIVNGAMKEQTRGSTNYGLPVTTSTSNTVVSVWDDPNEKFVAQSSTFSFSTPYASRESSGCYDEAGSSGAQYIATSLSTLDTFKILRESYETAGDGTTRSTTGLYAKVECTINPVKHFQGVKGVTS